MTTLTQLMPAETPIQAQGPVDTSPIVLTPPSGTDLDPLWAAIIPETRARSNDVHLPMSLAYAERLIEVHPQANAELVRVTIVLHDTGWAQVDQEQMISEGFRGDWRKADVRFQHEEFGCEIARRVLPPLGYSDKFIDAVCAIIDGHDTRPVAYSLEDALVRDADRLWRFDHACIALAAGWFGTDMPTYCAQLRDEILPEMLTEAGLKMATSDLMRSEALLKMDVLR